MQLKRLTDWVVVLLSGTILIAILYAGWCDLIDGRIYKPIIEWGTRSKGPTHVLLKQKYQPGEMVYARVIFQKQRPISGLIQWQLINHEIRQFPERSGSLPIGVWDHTVPVEILPKNLPPGKYWFAGTVRYKVNWLSTVTYDLWTNCFEVVAK